jgi:small subunit ribosomal protein S4
MMGGIKRQRKKIETPGHPYDKARLERELPLVGTYGLRNKRELWRARTILSTARQLARGLLALDPEARKTREQELLSRLSRFGMLPQNSNLDSVLALEIRVVLERRLQTIVFRKGLAASPYQARQFITHRHIAIGTGVATSPSRLITVAEEELISYAPRSPLNDQGHPSRPQAPPAFDAGQPEKKEEPKRGRTGRDGKPRRKEEAPKKEAKPEVKPKPEGKKEVPKKEAKPEVKPKPEGKKEVPKKETPKTSVKTIPEVKKEVPKKEAPKKETPKPSVKTIPEVKKEVPKKELLVRLLKQLLRNFPKSLALVPLLHQL